MAEQDDLEARRAEWLLKQKRAQQLRDVGLAVLALGVLLLVYVLLFPGPR